MGTVATGGTDVASYAVLRGRRARLSLTVKPSRAGQCRVHLVHKVGGAVEARVAILSLGRPLGTVLAWFAVAPVGRLVECGVNIVYKVCVWLPKG